MYDHWKIVLRSILPQDIYLAQGLLESAGIPTLLEDELTTQIHNFYSNALGGVKLLVHEDHREDAVELLKSSGYLVESGAQASEVIEIIRTSDRAHCPYCGSEDIVRKKNVEWIVLIIYFLLGALFPIFKPVYTCFDCSRSWRYRKP